MKRLHRSAPVRMLCLALACLAGLTACAPGGAAGAEPAPIEVPPPVEQTNEGLTVFYTDFKTRLDFLCKLLDRQYHGLGKTGSPRRVCRYGTLL